LKLYRPLVLLAVFVGISGCLENSKFGALGLACPQMTGSTDPLDAQYSANAQVSAKVAAFVAASRDLAQVSAQIEGEAAEACRRMGRDLDIPEDTMRPPGSEPGGEAKAACGALSARLDTLLRAGFQMNVSVRPPACSADVQAGARCSGSCSGQIDPGRIVAECEPGRLSGYCTGTCQGSCEGNCRGQCDGQCTMRDASGQCTGRCSGTCHGSCDATCHARCEGQWQAPRCEGSVQGPSVDAQCQASCNARAEIRASCVPAQVMVQSSAQSQEMARLAGTLQANLPLLLHAELALGKRLVQTSEIVVRVGADIPKIIGNAGAQALACVAAAADASVTASVRIKVSVQASANVSGRVGAGT
jgi:hypothetical protein